LIHPVHVVKNSGYYITFILPVGITDVMPVGMPADMPVGKHGIIWPTGVPVVMPVGVSTVMPVGVKLPTGKSKCQLAKSFCQLAGVLFSIFQYQFLTKVSNVNQETCHFCNKTILPFHMIVLVCF